MATDRKVYLLRSVWYAGQVRHGEIVIDGEVVEAGETLVLPVAFAAELVNARKATYVEEAEVSAEEPAPEVEVQPPLDVV